MCTFPIYPSSADIPGHKYPKKSSNGCVEIAIGSILSMLRSSLEAVLSLIFLRFITDKIASIVKHLLCYRCTVCLEMRVGYPDLFTAQFGKSVSQIEYLLEETS